MKLLESKIFDGINLILEYFQNRLYIRSQKISIRCLYHNLKNHNKKIIELSSKIQSFLHGEKPIKEEIKTNVYG